MADRANHMHRYSRRVSDQPPDEIEPKHSAAANFEMIQVSRTRPESNRQTSVCSTPSCHLTEYVLVPPFATAGIP